MAIFLLSGIVTSLVGSIGGTTFKRGVNNLIAQKKSFGASKSKLLQNKQLNPLADIFRRWRTLSPSLQEDWNAAALTFMFPDKFGTPKNLTGRQLFTKLNSQLLTVGTSIDDPDGINSDLLPFTLGLAYVSVGSQTANINKTAGVLFQNYRIQAQVQQAPIYNSSPTKRKVIEVALSSGNSTIDFSNAFFENFTFMDDTYNVGFYVTAINDYGFTSVPQFVKAIVT